MLWSYYMAHTLLYQFWTQKSVCICVGIYRDRFKVHKYNMGREPTFKIAAVFCKGPYTDTYPHINMFRPSAMKWLSLNQSLFLKSTPCPWTRHPWTYIMGSSIPCILSPQDKPTLFPRLTRSEPKKAQVCASICCDYLSSVCGSRTGRIGQGWLFLGFEGWPPCRSDL